MTIIISAFPGTGKSYYCKLANERGLKVLDSDSSEFSWLKPGIANPDFPNNYIQHIKKHYGMVDIILISSHSEVREALAMTGFSYVSVYPSINCDAEYARRFRERGSSEAFIDNLMRNWQKWLGRMFIDNCSAILLHFVLRPGQYLSDMMLDILKEINELEQK